MLEVRVGEGRPRDPLIGAGLVCLALGAVGSIWTFFASQSPSSPFHLGFLPGPVQRFAFWALATGVLLVVFGEIAPRALEGDALTRFERWLLVATALKIGGLFLGAAWSVYGVQIIDPRPRSVVVMGLRLLGDAIFVVLVVRLAVLWLRRQRS
jgi:hypothetical protein